MGDCLFRIALRGRSSRRSPVSPLVSGNIAEKASLSGREIGCLASPFLAIPPSTLQKELPLSGEFFGILIRDARGVDPPASLARMQGYSMDTLPRDDVS